MAVYYGTDLSVKAHCLACGWLGRLGGFVVEADSPVACVCGGKRFHFWGPRRYFTSPPTLWQRFRNWLATLRKVR